ncbi:MAG: MOSC domain-containing protein [Pseudomonadota bacterium]
MTRLTPTSIYGTATTLLINPDRSSGLQSERRTSVTVSYEGFEGEAHGGLTRPSCSRVLQQYAKRGTELRNTRQITLVGAEDLVAIAQGLDIPTLEPEWIGANLVLDGMPDVSYLPPASRLLFDGGVTLTIDYENGPCRQPADIIEALHPGHGRAFPKVAAGKRGTTAWVERTGTISVGERCRLHIPPRHPYPHA